MRSAANPTMDRINTSRRHHQARHLQIRRWKAELAAQSIPGLYDTAQRILPPEHLAGRIEFARPDALANARAAHNFSIQRHGREAVHLEIQFLAEGFKQFNIPASPVTKMERAPDAHALKPAKIARQLADELLAGFSTERLIES